MPNNYLFTWKADKWPYEKLRALVDEFAAGRKVTEPWRVAAHKVIRPGDLAYLLKQGDPPRGIFAVGTIAGPAVENPESIAGEGRWQVPITFRALVDPTKELLVSERELLLIPAPAHRWRTQASGVSLEPAAARAIDEIIRSFEGSPLLSSLAADDADFDPASLEDARETVVRSIKARRGQSKFRATLINAYGRRCAITGCEIEDLLEAAHIVPYKGPRTNHVKNGLLLRSDIHTLFDCGLIAVDENMTLILAPQLIQSSYKSLAKRKLRLPDSPIDRPDIIALAMHRKFAGL